LSGKGAADFTGAQNRDGQHSGDCIVVDSTITYVGHRDTETQRHRGISHLEVLLCEA
jgi:hypothetical protein